MARYVSLIPFLPDTVSFAGICDLWSTSDVSSFSHRYTSLSWLHWILAKWLPTFISDYQNTLELNSEVLFSFWFNLPQVQKLKSICTKNKERNTSDVLMLIYALSNTLTISQFYSLFKNQNYTLYYILEIKSLLICGLLQAWHYSSRMCFLVTYHISDTVLNSGCEPKKHGLCPLELTIDVCYILPSGSSVGWSKPPSLYSFCLWISCCTVFA